MTLEKMADFFAARLDGYDEHMLTEIEGAGYFVLTDYFAGSEEEERFYFSELARMRREQGLDPDAFYHYDTPLTAAHERELLRQAGFLDVRIMRRWGDTYTILAGKL